MFACEALHVQGGFAGVVIAPHARLAAGDFLAFGDVIPTIWPVIDAVEQKALVTGANSGIGEAVAQRIGESSPYSSVEDLVRRTGTGRPQLESLATAGALEGLAPRDGAPEIHERRRALWAGNWLTRA